MTSTYELCRGLVKMGCEVRVLTTNAAGLSRVLDKNISRQLKAETGLHIRYCSRVGRGDKSMEQVALIPHYVGWADVVHLTAVYSLPTLPTLIACNIANRPIVWSPRGALQHWHGSTKAHVKSVFETLCKYQTPPRMAFHATSEEERSQILSKFSDTTCTVIPNGVWIPSHISHSPDPTTFRILFMGRLHPIKGLENLLHACSQLKGNWKLTIAGDGDAEYVRTLTNLIHRLGLTSRVDQPGHLNSESKEHLWATADVLIVPSFTESFALVIAEALARAVPVIASKGTPWSRLHQEDCGLWVDNDPNTLANAMTHAQTLPLRAMGERGRAWMERDFDWELLAPRMLDLYHSVYKSPSA